MTAPTSTTVAIPDRMWFVNTCMRTFRSPDRDPADTSAFAHWLAAGRMFLLPRTAAEFDKSLVTMLPGDPVFAYEDQVGVVAVGRVCGPKDLTVGCGPADLFPEGWTKVKSVAVDWDTSITRTVEQVSSRTKIGGRPLQTCDHGHSFYLIAVEMLQELHDRKHADPDADEAVALRRIETSRDYDPTMRTQLNQARVGQGRFRAAVLAREPACRVTGISKPPYLVASHIKPWAVCTAGEHLDGANGLMLAPHVDHLFDTGLISFTDKGQVVLAPALDRAILRAWHIDETTNVGPFAPDQARYLAYHRNYVLGQPRARRQRNLVGDAPQLLTPAEVE